MEKCRNGRSRTYCRNRQIFAFPYHFPSIQCQRFWRLRERFYADYEINENKPNGEYFEGYGDFGAESDPLYAKAISLISGNEVTTPTRAVNQAKEQMLVIATPRLNRIGMIK